MRRRILVKRVGMGNIVTRTPLAPIAGGVLRRLAVAAVLLSLISSCVSARSLSIVKLGLLPQAPIIDGIVRDEEWPGAAPLGEFVAVMTGSPALRKTTGRIGYD